MLLLFILLLLLFLFLPIQITLCSVSMVSIVTEGVRLLVKLGKGRLLGLAGIGSEMTFILGAHFGQVIVGLLLSWGLPL